MNVRLFVRSLIPRSYLFQAVQFTENFNLLLVKAGAAMFMPREYDGKSIQRVAGGTCSSLRLMERRAGCG